MRNEIVYGLSDAEYFASEGLSKHKLDDFAKAPLLYKHRLGKEFKPSRSMELGTLVHKKFLNNRVAWVVPPTVNRRTKAGKALWREFCEDNALAGLTVVTQEEENSILGAVDSLGALLDVVLDNVEVTMYWERDGVQCRGKADAIHTTATGSVLIYDIKTTSDISKFDRDFFRLRYDHQAAWYSYGYEKLTGKIPAFVFLVADMEAPHLSQCVLVSGRTIDKANASIDSTLLNFKQCHATNHWPNLPHTRLI
jgi:hypothetical protein